MRTDEQLVQACLEGDSEAWSELIEKYQRLVYSIPIRYRLSPEESADVFQGVWIDLYRGLANLKRVGGLGSWLITATTRRCLLHKKRLERHPAQSIESAPPIADLAPDPLALREQAEREQGIRDAVAALPARCRELVRMLFFEQPPVPYAEVGRRLGLAEGSIGFTRSRCLKKLRKALLQEEHDG